MTHSHSNSHSNHHRYIQNGGNRDSRNNRRGRYNENNNMNIHTHTHTHTNNYDESNDEDDNYSWRRKPREHIPYHHNRNPYLPQSRSKSPIDYEGIKTFLQTICMIYKISGYELKRGHNTYFCIFVFFILAYLS